MYNQRSKPMMLDTGDQAIAGHALARTQPSKQAQRVLQEIDMGVLRAHGRATYLVAQDEAAQFVTETAMLGVVRVSMFEQMCGQIAPLATGRLQTLADAYAMGAARRVMDAGR